MSTTSTSRPDQTEHDPSGPSLLELADYLPSSCFPARADEVQATLIRKHAPTSLLWVVARLPLHRRYQSLTDLVGDLDGPARTSLAPEPW
jgi:hypothetical protein